MKEKIFFLIKDKTYDYKNDYFICSLLIDNKLDNILVKYNSKSDLITLKKLLDDFISFYYLYFSFLKKSDLYLIILINSINHINLDFLNSKRICVNNFYSNIKYMYFLPPLLLLSECILFYGSSKPENGQSWLFLSMTSLRESLPSFEFQVL